jgi:hypothetical protein
MIAALRRISARRYLDQLFAAEEISKELLIQAIEKAKAEGYVVTVFHDEVILEKTSPREVNSRGEQESTNSSAQKDTNQEAD